MTTARCPKLGTPAWFAATCSHIVIHAFIAMTGCGHLTAQWIVDQQRALDRLVTAGTEALSARRPANVPDAIMALGALRDRIAMHGDCHIPARQPRWVSMGDPFTTSQINGPTDDIRMAWELDSLPPGSHRSTRQWRPALASRLLHRSCRAFCIPAILALRQCRVDPRRTIE